MDKIIIRDLEVFFHVGVPEAERAAPQRLLLSVELETDVAAAAASDDVSTTIDYFKVAQRLRRLGEGQSWRLIERLATDIAEVALREFGARKVFVEVKKFSIPETRYVAVQVHRSTLPTVPSPGFPPG